MTNEQINRHIAERVMGWTTADTTGPVECWQVDERTIKAKEKWSPSTDIGQALQAVRKWCSENDDTIITIAFKGDWAQVTSRAYNSPSVHHAALPEHLSRALLAATGGEA